jgi:hypothetical protein
MPTPSQAGTPARRRPTRAPKPVTSPFEVPASEETETVEPAVGPVVESPQEDSNMSVTEAETTENAETAEPATEAAKPGRKPMDPAERQKRATYRACVAAQKLLTENGFSVTQPEGWEDPEADRLRESAKRAIEALKAAGIDPSTIGIPASAE